MVATLSTTRARRYARNAVAVVLAGALGVGLAYTYHALVDDEPAASTSVPRVRGSISRALASRSDIAPATGDRTDASPISGPAEVDPPSPPAPAPRDAVSQFLDHEVAQDFAGSYGLLSAADRADGGSRTQWIAAHGDLPPVVAYRIDHVSESAAGADVVVDVDLRSTLNQVVGLVPAKATATYAAVREDGGWRVFFAGSTLAPRYPPDTLAGDAVRAWARERQACHKPVEYAGGLLGAPGRADALCHAKGVVAVANARALPDTRADQPFLAAFGPAVHEWARVVPLTAPVHMDVVVAPVRGHWLVIGVLQASSGSS